MVLTVVPSDRTSAWVVEENMRVRIKTVGMERYIMNRNRMQAFKFYRGKRKYIRRSIL